MAFAGPNTQFKMTLRRQRQVLFKAGHDYIYVYNHTLGYKLGNEQTTGMPFTPPPNGQVPQPASALGPFTPSLSDITNIPKL